MRIVQIVLLAALIGGCASQPGTITPQAQAAISRLPAAVIKSFRDQNTNVQSARARTRVMPDQSIEYEIDFVDDSGTRKVARYRADGSSIE